MQREREKGGLCYFIRRLKIIMVPPSRSICHKFCGVSRGNIGREVRNVTCRVRRPSIRSQRDKCKPQSATAVLGVVFAG